MENPLDVDPRLAAKRKGPNVWLRLPPALEREVRAFAKKKDLQLNEAMIRLMAAGLDLAGRQAK